MPFNTGPVGKTIPLDIRSRYLNRGAGDFDNPKPEISKALQIFPWWLYKPPAGQDISVLGQNSFVAAGTVTLANCSTQLGPNDMAVVRGIDFYVNSMTPATVISFGLFINGNPAPAYGAVTIFPRTAVSVVQSFDTTIFIPAGSLIQVKVTDTDGGSYLVGAGYQGWSVPTNIDDILGISGGAYTGV